MVRVLEDSERTMTVLGFPFGICNEPLSLFSIVKSAQVNEVQFGKSILTDLRFQKKGTGAKILGCQACIT